jgi:NAD(P)-dependent dehydrogenase (short-subunit alcohol dehydrogenase family)
MNSVSPGPVDTPILGDFIETLGARAEEDMRVMDRPGRADDIAPVVAFLLSDMTTWVRGTNIPVDGGMSSNILCEMHGLI